MMGYFRVNKADGCRMAGHLSWDMGLSEFEMAYSGCRIPHAYVCCHYHNNHVHHKRLAQLIASKRNEDCTPTRRENGAAKRLVPGSEIDFNIAVKPI